jgi:hypothetical protein
MKPITIVILSLLITSCASDTFVMNKFRSVMFPAVVGYRADNPLTVNLIADDALRIEESSVTALRMFDETQYKKSFYLKPVKSVEFSVVERTSPLADGKKAGIKAVFKSDKIDVYENDKYLYSYREKKINVDELLKFQIVQDAKYTTMIVDCDTIIRHKTDIPGTEYTLFATEEGAEIEIYSFDVSELYETLPLW